jgi:hypothetical protein
MITLSIDVTKINKNLLKAVTKKDGTKATYLNLILWPNKDGKDQYDNDGFVKQSLTKAQRDEGIETAILGNYQDKGDGSVGGKASPAPITPHNFDKANAYAPADKDDDLPF